MHSYLSLKKFSKKETCKDIFVVIWTRLFYVLCNKSIQLIVMIRTDQDSFGRLIMTILIRNRLIYESVMKNDLTFLSILYPMKYFASVS